MRERNRGRPIGRWGFAVLGLLGGLLLAAPAAAAPINDNYLSSLRLNDPHTKLDRTDTLRDLRDTTGATVQTDLFNPPMIGGPLEPTTCEGLNYGATVWYDFHPDVNGAVRIRTSGFDNVVSLMTFSDATALPDLTTRRCVTNLATMTQELDAPVAAGKAYTVQIGGVNNAQGMLEFLFDFIPDIVRINADATLAAKGFANSARIQSLSVTAAPRARVEVRCTRGCRSQVKTGTKVSFAALRGRSLPVGAKLEIFVTAPNAIGAYIEYRIKPNTFQKVVRCLKPGSRKPLVSCT